MNKTMNNTDCTGAPIWSEQVSQTECPKFSESTSTSDQPIIFESTIYEYNYGEN